MATITTTRKATPKKTVEKKVAPKKPAEPLVEPAKAEKKVLTEEVTPEDIEKGKQDAIKALSGVDNLNLENLSDEELDSLLGTVAKESTEIDKDSSSQDVDKITEEKNSILEDVDKIFETEASKEEVVDKLVEEIKFNKTEAEKVYEMHEKESAEHKDDFFKELFKRGFSC